MPVTQPNDTQTGGANHGHHGHKQQNEGNQAQGDSRTDAFTGGFRFVLGEAVVAGLKCVVSTGRCRAGCCNQGDKIASNNAGISKKRSDFARRMSVNSPV
ncbi:MAG: hypothetical protein KDE09_15165 [Anaerolineales bacterium]|nr:hypothetical protein [Anaerolineales bacterium]